MTKFDIAYFSEEQLRRQRRWRWFKIYLGAGLFYLLILGSAYLILRSSFFRFQKIEISGYRQVSEEDILTVLKSKIFDAGGGWSRVLGFNHLFIWPENLNGEISKFLPSVKRLEIKKDYWRKILTIKVEERQPYGIWCRQSQNQDEENLSSELEIRNSDLEIPAKPVCWWFDNEGTLFKPATMAEGSLLRVVNDYSQKNLGLNSKILPDQFLNNLFSILEVASAAKLNLQEIKLNDINLQEIEVDTYGGLKIYFSLRFDNQKNLAVIDSLKQSPGLNKIQYIDFRVENRAYYK